MEELDLVAGRKVFSRAGMAVLIVIIISVALAYVTGFFLNPKLMENEWIQYLLLLMPQYVIAMPLAALLLRKKPAMPIAQKRLTAGQLCIIGIICYTIMYAGNLVGTIINLIIQTAAQSNMTDAVEQFFIEKSIWSNLMFAVILGPVAEELFFRKLLISRLLSYGEKPAVIVSALLFGLLHGNLSQFFYAFGLGLAFGYLFVKTGKVVYTIAFHMIINLFGGVISVLVYNSHFILRGFYGLILLGIVITGIVLFFVNKKRIVMSPGLYGIPKGKSAVYVNAGMILCFIVCAVYFTANTYQMFLIG